MRAATVVMLLACYHHEMNLQVKKVPAALHERLRQRARLQNRTLSDLVLAAIERELARHEWLDRLRTRPEVDLGVSAASLVEEDRTLRDQELR